MDGRAGHVLAMGWGTTTTRICRVGGREEEQATQRRARGTDGSAAGRDGRGRWPRVGCTTLRVCLPAIPFTLREYRGCLPFALDICLDICLVGVRLRLFYLSIPRPPYHGPSF